MASRRKYVTTADVEGYADIDVSDTTEAEERISVAEEIIDAYVRNVDPDVKSEYYGTATGGNTTTLLDTSSDSPLQFNDDYFTYCEVEIIGGTNKGEVRTIASSSKDNQQLTFDSAFSSAIDSTSVYVIRQLSRFPRTIDVIVESEKYYKRIPDAVKRAVLAQMEYMINKGEGFFMDGVTKDSESLGDYSFTSKKVNLMIAPKARMYLKKFVNRIGKILV